MKNATDQSPDIFTQQDIDSLIEEMVVQRQAQHNQQAQKTLLTLLNISEDVDLSNPYLVRLMANAASGVKLSTERLADIDRQELQSQLKKQEGTKPASNKDRQDDYPALIEISPQKTGNSDKLQEGNHGKVV